ncbi:MAG: hypothetical protein HY821_07035 [Acidobacteria bacterium]|nr:hypothetical protein [Acidobacteriota bacterium]
MISRRDAMKTMALAGLPAVSAAMQPGPAGKVKHIDIIHHSHTDIGFTDNPSMTRELQVRFLDAALEACLLNPKVRWTAEVTVTVEDWWNQAPAARRSQLVRTVQSGQMDVMALPFNQAPFMDGRQWRQALDWLPGDVRKLLNPRVAMQNDVNGFPRAGAMLLLERGINHLLMGINADMGGPPFRRPSAFQWKMPNGKTMFVWLGEHYGTAYSWFEAERWQHGQAKGATTTLRPPYAGDHLKTDEASLKKCQAHLLQKLAKLEGEGYDYPRLLISYTNQWRYDNDPPFPPLAQFVEAWNKLGLQPSLRLTTATQAVLDMEKAVAAVAPTHQGEWTDWWANGNASGPRELAASRKAKRWIDAALSPQWGPTNASIDRRVSAMLKDLCLFDEHTWGANISVQEPYSLDTIAQYTEKSLLAYKPMGQAEWLFSQRARLAAAGKPAGDYVANTAPMAFTGWVRFPGIERKPQWVEGLAARSLALLPGAPAASTEKPVLKLSAQGWPLSAQWLGMKQPLFGEGLGDLLNVFIKPPNQRSSKMFPERLSRTAAIPGPTKLEETEHTLVFTQPMAHPSLVTVLRRLEIFRKQPRATLTVRFDRKPNLAPEAIYLLMPFPTGAVLPKFSSGDAPFTPFQDQLPGSCRDYYAVDSWAQYSTPDGSWLWVTRDAPMVTVGGPHTWQRITDTPKDVNRLWSQVFDNFWHTNFVGDGHGLMEFQYELAWAPEMSAPLDWARTLLTEPLVVSQPGLKASPELMKSLFTP